MRPVSGLTKRRLSETGWVSVRVVRHVRSQPRQIPRTTTEDSSGRQEGGWEKVYLWNFSLAIHSPQCRQALESVDTDAPVCQSGHTYIHACLRYEESSRWPIVNRGPPLCRRIHLPDLLSLTNIARGATIPPTSNLDDACAALRPHPPCR